MKQRERFEDQEEALRIVLDAQQSGIWTAMPAIVSKFDTTLQTCECQVAIQGTKVAQDGTVSYEDISVLVDVPVYRFRGNGFALTVPLAVGDEGLVVFASRCIDTWWESGGPNPQQPFEERMHDLSDGFFLPGFNSKAKKLSAFATDALEMRNDAGDVKVTVKVDRVIVTAKNSVMTIKQDEIDIVATAVKITGDVTVTGKLTSTDTTSLGGGALAVKLADGSNATKVKAT